MTITLVGERPKSWNLVYSGQHWSHRAAEAKRVHSEVKASIPTVKMVLRDNYSGQRLQTTTLDPNPFTTAVDITITAYFKSRPLDADNIASKFYIDGLKGWLIKDDSPEYVASVTTRSRVDAKNPRVEIAIEEANG